MLAGHDSNRALFCKTILATSSPAHLRHNCLSESARPVARSGANLRPTGYRTISLDHATVFNHGFPGGRHELHRPADTAPIHRFSRCRIRAAARRLFQPRSRHRGHQTATRRCIGFAGVCRHRRTHGQTGCGARPHGVEFSQHQLGGRICQRHCPAFASRRFSGTVNLSCAVIVHRPRPSLRRFRMRRQLEPTEQQQQPNQPRHHRRQL